MLFRSRGKIVLEMGRFLAAFCGYYVTRIVDQKRNLGQNYCIVDGGIHHLNYFGQMMAMKIPKFCHVKQETEYTKSRTEQPEKEVALNESGEEEAWNICGSLCTVSDVIVKQLPLVDAKIGDVLVFERTGAYSVTEGIYLFLSRDLPPVSYTHLAAIAVGLILEVLFLAVDYSRTEHLEFEDDEYHYYVKAVPKVAVSAPEKSCLLYTSRFV